MDYNKQIHEKLNASRRFFSVELQFYPRAGPQRHKSSAGSGDVNLLLTAFFRATVMKSRVKVFAT